MRRKLLFFAIPLLAVFAAIGITIPANGSTHSNVALTGSTSVTNRDDSGTNGNWATDNFTRTISVVGHGVVANSLCPGISIGACHHITATINDHGTFTTVVGDTVPGQGYLNGGSAPLIGTAVTGPMNGTYHYDFYTNQPVSAFNGSAVPSVDGDSPSTGVWPEQFFPNGSEFWDSNSNASPTDISTGVGSWLYKAFAGSDSACHNAASQWVDGSAGSWGSLPADGNILAPDASSC